MASSALMRWSGRSSELPPIPKSFLLPTINEPTEARPPAADELHSISSYVCIIEYDHQHRRIVCRCHDLIGVVSYIGAVCQSSNGYRQFRCDRITAVFDAITGELLGDGSYFDQFAVDSSRFRVPAWGLSPSRRATLVGGLNVLAFMARCDGKWHPLEADVIEKFVCTMWLRKEWDGEPPIKEIIDHTAKLAPTADTFFAALKHYSHSSSSSDILRRAIGDLVMADGVLHSAECSWGLEVDAFFADQAKLELEKAGFDLAER